MSQYLHMAKSQKKYTIYLREERGKRSRRCQQFCTSPRTLLGNGAGPVPGERRPRDDQSVPASGARAEDHLTQQHSTTACHTTVRDPHLNHSEAKKYSGEQTGHVFVFPLWPSSTPAPMISSPTLTCYITFHSRLITSLPFN